MFSLSNNCENANSNANETFPMQEIGKKIENINNIHYKENTQG
jgi:hypothetical protein